MLRERVDAMADPSEQTAAAEWLLWCQHYVAERDPSTKPIVFPSVTPPRDTALADFRKRLVFSCNYW